MTKTFQSSFNQSTTYKREDIKFVLPDVEIPDGIKSCAEVLQQTIVVAHHLAISMYPELNTESQTFGQIRSKLADQLLDICKMREPKS